MSSLPLHIKAFNDKVRVMNQTNGRTLSMSCEEARNLQAEIYTLLAENVRLNGAKIEPDVSVEMDGGTF